MATATTLYSFTGTDADGANPWAGLVLDANGDLFGTTRNGGSYGSGTVFEIKAGETTATTLYSFTGTGTSGVAPTASVILDAAGNLFGTTYAGGSGSSGTVFEIKAGETTATTLYSFTGVATDGAFPLAGLTLDANGNLFGTTIVGGTDGVGTVFEIKAGETAATTLYSFTGVDTDGEVPYGGLIVDGNGNLFGTTVSGGGPDGGGTVFEIKAGETTPVTLYSFTGIGTDGYYPYSSVTLDAGGNLFGTTAYGGSDGNGTVFEIKAGATTAITLYSFTSGADGAHPNAGMTLDPNGNLFGTTFQGGSDNNGTVFEIKAGETTATTLYSFTGIGTDGAILYGGVVLDSDGNLFGTTGYGGSDGNGTVFEITDVACFVTGTMIRTAAGDLPVETLRTGDMVGTQKNDEITFQPVKWIGRRRIDLMAHPRLDLVAPVRILRGAFADNKPYRDLLVSPDHAIFCDGVLICARQLLNGSTIRQEQGLSAVEYFHVELSEHAILLSEGLPTESYLDTGNRGVFANADVPLVLHPNLADVTDCPTREAASCAPVVWDEASVRPVWEQLVERAASLDRPIAPVQTTSDPAICLMAGGRTLPPFHTADGCYQFMMPPNTDQVCIVSRSGSPTSAKPWLEDRRRLGVYVERMIIRAAGEMQEIPVDHPALSRGWWDIERDGVQLRRWTDGNAILPLPVVDGPFILELRATTSSLAYIIGQQEIRDAA